MEEDIPDLPALLTEAADEENRKIIEAFDRRKQEIVDTHTICGWMSHDETNSNPSSSSHYFAMSVRANYAMRQMPAILDHAAKNHVLEVREMLEVKGADPNYIHVRKDSWAISDTRLEFYEEITPLVVAAEYGACEVIKVLFNHPQIDVNLCCEIYNYYTAYDVTIAKKHPHAAALLRARGVLPASSEHVYKPPFDVVHGRPLRETLNHTYEEDSFGEGEMPRWDTVAQGDPDLALELQKVADALSTSKEQSLKNRTKIFKAFITDWHPDRAPKNGVHIATKVFQWLQVVKPWYLEEQDGAMTGEMPPLMRSERIHAPFRQPVFRVVRRLHDDMTSDLVHLTDVIRRGAVAGAVPTSGRAFSGFSSGRRRHVSSLLQRGLPDGDGYHDMILPCGLFQEEVIELMYRDLNPEDYDLLNKLDERISKKTMGRNAVDQLPSRLAKDCECTECGICLEKVGPKVMLAQLPCRHAFHPACISRWLTQCKSSCPLCSTALEEAPRLHPAVPRRVHEPPTSPAELPASSSDGLQVCFL
eukprot:symbB.v1.2.013968.t1/scaffold1004.1/size147139/3